MQHYVGTKIIKARPMTRGEYNHYRGLPRTPDVDLNEEGFLVEYTDGGAPNHSDHAGYISWSPREVFEAAYLPMGDLTGQADWVQRLMAEKVQLDDRLTKLTTYLDSTDVENSYILKMREQQQLMQGLSKLLDERLEMVL